MDCIFCKIIKDDIPSYTIYEDNIVKVFLDVNPDSNGHCLIVPKRHYKDLSDIDQDTLNHIMKISKLIKEKIENKLNVDGVTLIQNNGDIQEVKHFHMHIKPYYKIKQNIINLQKIYDILKG